MFQELGICEDDAELIVQLVEQCAEIRVRHLRASTQRHVSPRVFLSDFGLSQFGAPPQRIGKDPDGTAGSPHVLDFPAGHPVVDGASADADEFTCTRNGDCLSLDRIHIRLKLSAGV